MYAVMLSLYAAHSRDIVGHTCAVWQVYLFMACANNMKCMYTGVSGHIVDSSYFI